MLDHVYWCENLFFFLDPSCLVDVCTGLLLIQGRSTQLALHGAPGSCSVIDCCLVTWVLIYLRARFRYVRGSRLVMFMCRVCCE